MQKIEKFVVYVLELTLLAYMLIVKTTNEVHTETLFFLPSKMRKEMTVFLVGLKLILGKSTHEKNSRQIISILTRLSKRIKFSNYNIVKLKSEWDVKEIAMKENDLVRFMDAYMGCDGCYMKPKIEEDGKKQFFYC